MGENTAIEWTDATWQPITGCTVVSPGCTHCYAMRLAGTRLRNHPSRQGLTKEGPNGPVWTGEVRLNEQWLDQPLRWRKPRRIFVCAHGDLFHESVPDEWIDRVFTVMALAREHSFQVLTKRPERMNQYFKVGPSALRDRWFALAMQHHEMSDLEQDQLDNVVLPLPNVWLGTSIEGPAYWARAEHLKQTPAAVRFLSIEPLIEGLGTHVRIVDDMDWVIVGGESGPKARPMHRQWARDIRDACQAAGVPFFFKQWGEWAPAPVERVGKPLPGSIVPRKWLYAKRRHGFDKETSGYWVGKKRAGRLLDGREWNEMPRGHHDD